MNILISISLSLLVFFQSIGFGVADIFMMSDLVEHAKYHSEEYGDDFLTFFEKHYGELRAEHQQNQKEEKSQHEKLPFQHNSCNHLMAEVIVIGYEFPLKKSVVTSTVNQHFYYQDLYSFLERASIFQPPQFA
ncbi:MAG TPA: hypothetical protein VKX34_00780 [Aequorivita sp.]|nr:hypothetical protein [Aequorivita sp.]